MSEKGDGCTFMMLGFFVGIILGSGLILVLFGDPPSIPRDEAVKAGHAEYYFDKDNQRQWRWKNDGCKAVEVQHERD